MKHASAGSFSLQTMTITCCLSVFILINPSPATTPDYYYPDSAMFTNGTVRTLLFHDGKLFVGGNFSRVTGANGTFRRNDLAAFDVKTGEVTPFKANTDRGTVRAITAGAGKIYVGGTFYAINEVNRSKVAAVDPITGEVLKSFREEGGAVSGGDIWALAFSDRILYIGGSFTTVDNTERPFLAALNSGDGTLIERFNPAPGDPMDDSGKTPGGIYALEINPGNPEMLFAGGNFRRIGGDNDRRYLVSLYPDGTFGPEFRNPVRDPIIDIDIYGTSFYAGVGGLTNCVYAYEIGTGPFRRQWKGLRVHGDVQAVASTPEGFLFFGFHDGLFDSTDDDYRMAIIHGFTGELLDAYPLMNSFLGVRALDAGEGCVAAGGDFTQMNGRRQEYLAVFRKFPWSHPDVPPLETPVLVTPYNKKKGAPVTPLFKWEPVPTAASYILQLFDNKDLAWIVGRKEVSADTCFISGLDPATRYWWRVQAVNSTNSSGWSKINEFITAPGDADIPSLDYPANGAVNQPLDLTFSWHPTPSALSYTIEIAEDPLFQIELADVEGITDTTYSISGLENGRAYFWRISTETIGGKTGRRSARFSTITANPGVPRCITPFNDARQIETHPRLTWMKTAKATAYRVQMAYDSQFTDLLLDSAALADTVFSVNELREDTRYYWRVNASNAGGENWSLPMQFTTRYPLPGIPQPRFPEMGFVSQEDSIRLSWSAGIPHVIRYWVEMSADSTMADAFIDSTISDTAVLISRLQNNSDFFWRVKAWNVSGWSGFSTTCRFETRFPGQQPLPKNSLSKFRLAGHLGRVIYSIEEKSDVEFSLYDLTGKLRWRKKVKNRAPGQHDEAFDITRLPTGRYFLQVKTGKFQTKADAVLVR